MKVLSKNKPEFVRVEVYEENADVLLVENILETERDGEIMFEYDEYRFTIANRDNLKSIIENSFSEWMDFAKEKPVPSEPTIEELKAKLADTDYKIIKCYEYQMAGQPLPYDIQALHAERQAIRDAIAEREVQ